MQNKCIICSCSVFKSFQSHCIDYYLNSKEVVNYGICDKCGLIQQVPLPSDTSKYYIEYPIHQKRSLLISIARKLLHYQIYFRPGKTNKHMVLLDFGCGDGMYLNMVRTRVRFAIGYDPYGNVSQLISKHLNNIEIINDSAQLIKKYKNSIDCITAHFVLEHLVDIHSAFKYFALLNKNGGMLHIAVPNIHSWESKIFKRKWHGLDAPRHISFPDDNTIDLLSKKYNYKIKCIKYAMFPNTLAASIVNVISGKYVSWLYYLFIPVSCLLALIAPQGTKIYLLKKITLANG